jgi:hypothetical protein
LELRIQEVSFTEILATELGRTDDAMDLIFDLSQPEAPDDSFGFTINWSTGDEGTYTMQTGAGDPEEDAGENAHIELTISPYGGARTYTSTIDDTPSLSFRWRGNFSADELSGATYQAFFDLNSSEGGTCEAEVRAAGLRGDFACTGMSAVIDGALEPSGLIEISGHWEGTGKAR